MCTRGVFKPSPVAAPLSSSGLQNNPGRVTHQMEIDFYLINHWRNFPLHLTGTFRGKGVLQTAGKSWALASLLLGQWKITKEAKLSSALLTGSSWAQKTQREPRKRSAPLLTWGGEESGRRWGRGRWGQQGWGPALADVLTAVGHLGAGLLGLTVRHLRKWAGARQKTVRPPGAEVAPPHPLPARLELEILPSDPVGGRQESG